MGFYGGGHWRGLIKTEINFFISCIMVVLGDGRNKRFFCSVKTLQFFVFTVVEVGGRS